MAITTTTLSAAVGQNDTSVLLASITSLTAGLLIRIDNEIMRCVSVPSAATVPVPVLRGQEGSAQVAHANGSNVNFGSGASTTGTADFAQPAAGAPSIALIGAARARKMASYNAAGAIALPDPGVDMVAVINGTGALAMTLANPSKANDGDFLIIVGNGKAAHTVTWATATSGIGNGGANVDVATFAAGGQQCLILVACGGFWCLSILAGTLTNITVTMS